MTTARRDSDWRSLLTEMLAESDDHKLREKAELLEAAIFFRCQDLAGQAGAEEELVGLKGAAEALLKVQTENLGFPSSSSASRSNGQA